MGITKRRLGYMLIALSCAMVVASFFGFYGLFLPAIVPAFLGLGLFVRGPGTEQLSIIDSKYDDRYFDDVSGANGPIAQEWATLGDFPALNRLDAHDP